MKARLPQGVGAGPSNMNQMIKQAQKMQEDMARVQDELDAREYAGTSGGGMVEVAMTGKKEVVRVTLKPEVVDPDDIEMLEDLVAAAVNDALRAVEEDARQSLGAVTGGMGAPGMF